MHILLRKSILYKKQWYLKCIIYKLFMYIALLATQVQYSCRLQSILIYLCIAMGLQVLAMCSKNPFLTQWSRFMPNILGSLPSYIVLSKSYSPKTSKRQINIDLIPNTIKCNSCLTSRTTYVYIQLKVASMLFNQFETV